MRSVKKLIAAVMACVLILVGFVGCASKGKTLMKLDGNEMSVNLFELYLSRMKGMLCTTTYFGNSATREDFWDTWMDADTWITYNEHYTKVVLEASKTYLAALALFEEKGLKLPDSYIEEIDAEMEALVLNEADGSKTAFNAIISDYGVNYDLLREAYIVEAKIDYLEDYLFGVDGSKIGANLIRTITEDLSRFSYILTNTYIIPTKTVTLYTIRTVVTFLTILPRPLKLMRTEATQPTSRAIGYTFIPTTTARRG